MTPFSTLLPLFLFVPLGYCAQIEIYSASEKTPNEYHDSLIIKLDLNDLPVSLINLTMSPAVKRLLLVNGPAGNVTINFNFIDDCVTTTTTMTTNTSLSLYACIHDNEDVINKTLMLPSCDTDEWSLLEAHKPVSIELQGVRIGEATLEVYAVYSASSDSMTTVTNVRSLIASLPVRVVYVFTNADMLCIILSVVGMSLNMMGFGCTIRREELVKMFRNPTVLIIGFTCQYVVIPLTAYWLGIACRLSVAKRLALMACGCCPGGTPSNVSTMVLKGDLSRSVVMTFISTLSLIVITPYWMLTVGSSILQEDYPEASVKLPWDILTLFFLVFGIPCGSGMLIGCYRPKIARILSYVIRPVAMLLVIVVILITVVRLHWIFTYINTWPVIVTPVCLPIISSVIGLLVTLILTRSVNFSLTVMVETGIQNIAPAAMIIRAQTVLPEHEQFLSMIIPLLVIITGLSMVLIIAPIVHLIRVLRRRVKDATNSPVVDFDGVKATSMTNFTSS